MRHVAELPQGPTPLGAPGPRPPIEWGLKKTHGSRPAAQHPLNTQCPQCVPSHRRTVLAPRVLDAGAPTCRSRHDTLTLVVGGCLSTLNSSSTHFIPAVQTQPSSTTINCQCSLAAPCRKMIEQACNRYGDKTDEGWAGPRWNKMAWALKTLRELLNPQARQASHSTCYRQPTMVVVMHHV
jgi:hypothetical protein